MKFSGQSVTLFGVKKSEGDFEGKHYSSTTFYLPADLGSAGADNVLGMVTVPYKFGDASEFGKWAHLSKSWPPGGLPCVADFDVVVGRDGQGKDTAKLTLLSIKPSAK